MSGSADPSSFVHRFVGAAPAGAPTLLLLHGTGGNEEDLLGLGRMLLPSANLLSPRGRVLENGMPRFFRRLAEGVFDQEDLRFRTEELAGFVRQAAERYGFDPQRVVAVGYSNGANIAASMLLRLPGVLAGAVLFHAMTPFTPENAVALDAVPILISAGRNDPIVPASNTESLAALFRTAGADVTVHWQNNGHSLTADEVEAARTWITGRF